MKELHSITYYVHLLSEGCEDCPAYNEIGGCGAWASHCHIREEREEAENFMEDNYLTFEDFIALIEYWECIESLNYWNNAIVPRLEEEEDFEAADYDYWLECSRDAMWINNNC